MSHARGSDCVHRATVERIQKINRPAIYIFESPVAQNSVGLEKNGLDVAVSGVDGESQHVFIGWRHRRRERFPTLFLFPVRAPRRLRRRESCLSRPDEPVLNVARPPRLCILSRYVVIRSCHDSGALNASRTSEQIRAMSAGRLTGRPDESPSEVGSTRIPGSKLFWCTLMPIPRIRTTPIITRHRFDK
jgi:hypothetical protein